MNPYTRNLLYFLGCDGPIFESLDRAYLLALWRTFCLEIFGKECPYLIGKSYIISSYGYRYFIQFYRYNFRVKLGNLEYVFDPDGTRNMAYIRAIKTFGPYSPYTDKVEKREGGNPPPLLSPK